MELRTKNHIALPYRETLENRTLGHGLLLKFQASTFLMTALMRKQLMA